MDLLAKDKVSLLTLPPTDLKEGLPISSTSPEKASNNAPLVLLQLPSGWKPADLQQTRLMGGGQQAALVSDTQSFAVNRVETSNVLVMVPPTERSTKRSKVREDGRAMEARPCRLLKVGGSGAFFLELRETTLSVQRLAEALQNCVYEPYSSSTVAGRTIEELSLELQAPRAQIEQSLQRMQAFRVPDTDSYAILAEEAKLECLSAIVATLAEVDAYADYAEAGMDADTLVEDVVRHMSREERFTGVHAVVRHCLATLANDTLDTDRIKLDVHKVRLFYQPYCGHCCRLATHRLNHYTRWLLSWLVGSFSDRHSLGTKHSFSRAGNPSYLESAIYTKSSLPCFGALLLTFITMRVSAFGSIFHQRASRPTPRPALRDSLPRRKSGAWPSFNRIWNAIPTLVPRPVCFFALLGR